MEPIFDPITPKHFKGVSLPQTAGAVDLWISGGKIADIQPSNSKVETLLLPLMADVHIHIDKAFTARRTGAGATSLFDAIARMETDKSNWTQEDLYLRATESLEKAWKHGVTTVRSHVDWTTVETPTAWHVLNDLKREWSGRVDLQLASLSPIDLLAEVGNKIAATVRASDNVLGAFVYRNDNLSQKLKNVFTLSDKHDLHLDFHVDEGLDDAAQGFDLIVAQAAQRSDALQVLCGHACSLSVRPEDDVKRSLAAAADAKVGLVVLPTTNMYLQDNTPNRTPRLRGIAPMHEAKAAGIGVLIASDNVCDLFYPYGDYDLFDVFRGCVDLAHLDPVAWIDAISHNPAGWCGGSAVVDLAIGQPANFIAFEATDLHDGLSRPTAIRKVYRDGKKQLHGE